MFEVGAVEAVEAPLAVDDVVAFAVELGNDLRSLRALDVVLAHRALAAWHEAVGLRLRGVHRLPERRHHRVGAYARNAAVNQHDVEYRYLFCSTKIQDLLPA